MVWLWSLVGIVVACFGLMLTYRARVKPDLQAYIPQGSDTICCVTDRNVELILEFENRGISTWKTLLSFRKRRVAQDVTIAITFPSTFEIHHIERQKESDNHWFQAPDGTKYIFVPDPFHRTPPRMTSLRHMERETCRLNVTTPSIPGRYTLTFDVTSRQGSLRCNPVTVYVMSIY